MHNSVTAYLEFVSPLCVAAIGVEEEVDVRPLEVDGGRPLGRPHLLVKPHLLALRVREHQVVIPVVDNTR